MLMTEKKKPEITDPAYSTTKAGIIMGGIERTTVYRLCKNGKLGHFTVGNTIKIRQSDIDAYLKKYGVVPEGEEKEE